MSNQSKIYLLFIEEKAGSIDVQAAIENCRLKPFIDKLHNDASLEVIAQAYLIGDPLPEGFILLCAYAHLSEFVDGLRESGQIDEVKRILPFYVPIGTAVVFIDNYPFPAIVEFEDFFNFNQNRNSCRLIINKDQRDQYKGEDAEVVGRAYRIDGQDLVKIIVTHQKINRKG